VILSDGDVVFQIYAVFGFVFFLSVAASADRVTSDYDHAVTLSKYDTFMWIHEKIR